MLFLASEKSMYELLGKYINSNFASGKEIKVEYFHNAIFTRGQELGFKNIEEYCRYVLLLPYREMLREVKSLLVSYKFLRFFHDKPRFEAVTFELIRHILRSSQSNAGENVEETSGWLKKVLTTDFRLKGQIFKTLGVESAAGEEIYSAAMRFHAVLPAKLAVEITAFESDPSLLEEAKKAVYPRGKIMQVEDGYRALYFEETPEENFRVSDEIREKVKFLKFDVLEKPLNEADIGKYHLIFCDNLPRLYPESVAVRVIKNLIPYLSCCGYMMVGLSDNLNLPGLDKIDLDETSVYRRNREESEKIDFSPLTRKIDTLLNRIFYLKSLIVDNNLDESLKEVDILLEDYPANLILTHLKGEILIKKGDFESGFNQYKSAAAIDNNFLPSKFSLASIHCLKGRQNDAKNEIKDIIEKIDSFDESILAGFYDFNRGSFSKQCSDFEDLINSGEPVTLEKLSLLTERHRDEVSIPDIEIPDIFEKKQEADEKMSEDFLAGNSESISAVDSIKAVDITVEESAKQADKDPPDNNPDNDPWKKKIQEEEARRKMQESKNEDAEPDKTVCLREETPVAATAASVNKGLKIFQDEEPLEPQNELTDNKTKIKTSRVESPAHALIFSEVSPMDLNLTEKTVQKFSGGLQVNNGGGVGLSTSVAKSETTEQNSSRSPNPFERALPLSFISALQPLLEKGDAEGVLSLVEKSLRQSMGHQRETLDLLNKICDTFRPHIEPLKGNKKVPAKLLEAKKEITELRRMIDGKRLLEASMQINKIMKLRPKIDTLPERQQKRLREVKDLLDGKIERSQLFIDTYFTDPLSFFEEELWEALSHLTSGTGLIDTGKKLGLNPDQVPERFKRKY